LGVLLTSNALPRMPILIAIHGVIENAETPLQEEFLVRLTAL
jgi:hypothetical protein